MRAKTNVITSLSASIQTRDVRVGRSSDTHTHTLLNIFYMLHQQMLSYEENLLVLVLSLVLLVFYCISFVVCAVL